MQNYTFRREPGEELLDSIQEVAMEKDAGAIRPDRPESEPA
jgi:hypothetical protein